MFAIFHPLIRSKDYTSNLAEKGVLSPAAKSIFTSPSKHSAGQDNTSAETGTGSRSPDKAVVQSRSQPSSTTNTSPTRYNGGQQGDYNREGDTDDNHGNNINTAVEDQFCGRIRFRNIPLPCNAPQDLICEECETNNACYYCSGCKEVFCSSCADLCHPRISYQDVMHDHERNNWIRPLQYGDKSKIEKSKKFYPSDTLCYIEDMENAALDLTQPNTLTTTTTTTTTSNTTSSSGRGSGGGVGSSEGVTSSSSSSPPNKVLAKQQQPRYSANDLVLFQDPNGKEEAYGKVISQWETIHSEAAPPILRGEGSLYCYYVEMLGLSQDIGDPEAFIKKYKSMPFHNNKQNNNNNNNSNNNNNNNNNNNSNNGKNTKTTQTNRIEDDKDVNIQDDDNEEEEEEEEKEEEVEKQVSLGLPYVELLQERTLALTIDKRIEEWKNKKELGPKYHLRSVEYPNLLLPVDQDDQNRQKQPKQNSVSFLATAPENQQLHHIINHDQWKIDQRLALHYSSKEIIDEEKIKNQLNLDLYTDLTGEPINPSLPANSLHQQPIPAMNRSYLDYLTTTNRGLKDSLHHHQAAYSVIILSEGELTLLAEKVRKMVERKHRLMQKVFIQRGTIVTKGIMRKRFLFWKNSLNELKRKQMNYCARRIQTMARVWLCRNKLEECREYWAEYNEQQRQDLHNQFRYSTPDDPYAVSFDKEKFFTTHADVNRYAAFLRLICSRIIRFLQRKRYHLLQKSMNVWRSAIYDFTEDTMQNNHIIEELIEQDQANDKVLLQLNKPFEEVKNDLITQYHHLLGTDNNNNNNNSNVDNNNKDDDNHNSSINKRELSKYNPFHHEKVSSLALRFNQQVINPFLLEESISGGLVLPIKVIPTTTTTTSLKQQQQEEEDMIDDLTTNTEEMIESHQVKWIELPGYDPAADLPFQLPSLLPIPHRPRTFRDRLYFDLTIKKDHPLALSKDEHATNGMNNNGDDDDDENGNNNNTNNTMIRSSSFSLTSRATAGSRGRGGWTNKEESWNATYSGPTSDSFWLIPNHLLVGQAPFSLAERKTLLVLPGLNDDIGMEELKAYYESERQQEQQQQYDGNGSVNKSRPLSSKQQTRRRLSTSSANSNSNNNIALTAISELLLHGIDTFLSLLTEEEEEILQLLYKSPPIEKIIQQALITTRSNANDVICHNQEVILKQEGIMDEIPNYGKTDPRYPAAHRQRVRCEARIELAKSNIQRIKNQIKKLPQSLEWYRLDHLAKLKKKEWGIDDVLPAIWQIETLLHRQRCCYLYSNGLHMINKHIPLNPSILRQEGGYYESIVKNCIQNHDLIVMDDSSGCLAVLISGRLYHLEPFDAIYRWQKAHDTMRSLSLLPNLVNNNSSNGRGGGDFRISCPGLPWQKNLILQVLRHSHFPLEYPIIRGQVDPETFTVLHRDPYDETLQNQNVISAKRNASMTTRQSTISSIQSQFSRPSGSMRSNSNELIMTATGGGGASSVVSDDTQSTEADRQETIFASGMIRPKQSLYMQRTNKLV